MVKILEQALTTTPISIADNTVYQSIAIYSQGAVVSIGTNSGTQPYNLVSNDEVVFYNLKLNQLWIKHSSTGTISIVCTN
jgi:hypothetical protein